MTVRPWEIWSLCQMLITSHGEQAEAHARSKMDEANTEGKSGERIVWQMVLRRLPDCRSEASTQFTVKTD